MEDEAGIVRLPRHLPRVDIQQGATLVVVATHIAHLSRSILKNRDTAGDC